MLLTKKQILERLPISLASLDGLIAHREIPYIKLGRRVFIDSDTLDQFIQSKQVSAQKPHEEE